MMKIISWNIRGLGSRKKRRVMKDYCICHENLDVVLLQETKRESCDRRFVGSVWKVKNKECEFSQLAGRWEEWQSFGML